MDSCCKRESLETIVENAIQLSSTDIHLQCGQPIYLRHGDGLKATSFMCTTELIEDILRRCGIASVSYTHLDVYKRQVLRRIFNEFSNIMGQSIKRFILMN